MTKLPGGEFGGAWEAIAAAAGRRPRGRHAEFAFDSNSDLVDIIESDQTTDEARRERARTEFSRRLAKRPRR